MKGSQSVQRGWKAYQSGDLALAETEFSKAVSEGPDAAFGLVQRGLFQLRLDHFAEASQSFQAATEKEPRNPAPLFFLCLSQELLGEGPLADGCLEKLTQLCPHHQGLTSIRLLREIRRGNPLAVLHQLGFGEEAKSSSPVRMAIAGLGLGDPSWLPPDLSSSPYLLGPILLEVERRLMPRELQALEHRAEDLTSMLLELKPPTRSLLEELRNLKASFKSGPHLRKGRRLLEKAMGKEDLDEQRSMLNEAITHLEAGHALDAFSFRTAFHLGEAYLFSARGQQGQPHLRDPLLSAEKWFIESARMDGLNPYVLFYLALIQQLLGRPRAALDCYHKATEKFTKLPEAHYGMGQCHLLLGELSQAREMLLRAVNSDLTIARERMTLFANLLAKEGPEAFSRPLPAMPPEPEPPQTEPEAEPPEPKADSEAGRGGTTTADTTETRADTAETPASEEPPAPVAE